VAAPGGSNPLHPGTPPVIVAEIITKDKNGTPINTQFFHIKIPICQKVSQFQWYSFGGGFQVSQSDILRGNTYTLKIQDRQSLPSGIAYIDKFYISSGAAPNNELTNVSIDCNP
jgi:predicted RNA-binding protein with TRAM domain